MEPHEPILLTAQPTLSLPEMGREAPVAFRILRAGWNKTEKGDFLFDAQAATDVMAAYTTKGLDKVQIDFEHQSMQPPPSGGPAHKVAAGWFKPEVRDGELWATDVNWTSEAADMLAPERGAPKYRYFSPILFFNEETRRVTRVKNVALTNDPALDELEPLMAASSHAAALSTIVRLGAQVDGLTARLDNLDKTTKANATYERTPPMNDRTHAQVSLTAEDRQVAKMFGHSLEDVLAHKAKLLEDKQFEQPGMVCLSNYPGEQVSLTAEDLTMARMLGTDLRELVAYKIELAKRQRQHERLGYPGPAPRVVW